MFGRIPMVLCVVAGLGCPRALGDVDLQWRLDSTDTSVGSTIRVGLYAVASGQVDNPPNEPFTSVSVIFTWDPQVLQFVDVDDSQSPVNWLYSGMPNDRNTDGLNNSFDDGNAIYNAVRGFVEIPEATPAGLLIAHFEFEVLGSDPATPIEMLLAYGQFSATYVIDDVSPSRNILGSIDSITISVGTCPGDLNGDGVIDLGDLSRLLGNFGLSGASPADGDLNGDGVVDLSDLSRLLSLFGTNCP